MTDIACYSPAQTTVGAGQVLLSSSLPNFFSMADSKAAKPFCRKKSALLHVSSYEVDEGDLLELSRGKGAIVFSFSDVLSQSGFRRSILLSKMRLLLAACRKTGSGFVFASMAKSKDGMRSAREIAAFAAVLGASDVERKAAKESLERLVSRAQVLK